MFTTLESTLLPLLVHYSISISVTINNCLLVEYCKICSRTEHHVCVKPHKTVPHLYKNSSIVLLVVKITSEDH